MAIEEFATNSRAPETLGNLPALLSWRSVPLFTCEEGTEGMLVFWGERLIAVLGRIDGDRANQLGRPRMWHLEIGFGECTAPPSGEIFESLAHGLRWLAQCVQAGLGC
jgi:hypothetical protein